MPLMVELQLSSVVGAVHVATAPQMPASLLRLIVVGMPAIVGSSASDTVTVKDEVVTLPAPSVEV